MKGSYKEGKQVASKWQASGEQGARMGQEAIEDSSGGVG